MPSGGGTTRRCLLGGAMAMGAISCAPMALAQGRARRAAALRPFPTTADGAPAEQIRAIQTSQRVIALTFDDGPHPEYTPRLLDILAMRGMKASFFTVGTRVAQAPELIARMARDGHEIGNHSWSHPHMAQMSDAAILDEFDRAAAAVMGVTGSPPAVMRPPYGELDLRQSRMLREARHLPTILWSVDPQDWRRPGGWVVADHIIANARPGAVVLMHDMVEETVLSLPYILDTLAGQGYRFVTISDLLGWPHWRM